MRPLLKRRPAPRVPEPTLRGVLSATPLAHLLAHAVEKRLGGTIVLSGEGASLVLALEGGFVAKAKASAPVAPLGRVLLELGYIGQETHDRTLAALVPGAKHGELLVTSGAITRAQLAHGLRVQLLRKLQHGFGFARTAAFGLFDGFDMLAEMPSGEVAPIDPLPALWRGICAAPSREHVEQALARIGQTPLALAPGADLARFQFEADVTKALDLLRVQPMRAGELEPVSGLPSATARLLLYCLFLTKNLVSGEAALRARMTSRPPPVMSSIPPVRISSKPEAMPNESPTSVRMGIRAAEGPISVTRLAAPDLDPASLFERAEACVARREMTEAEALCRKARDLAPGEGRYLALLGWIEARRPMAPLPASEAIRVLDEAIALDGKCARAFYYRALLHKQLRHDTQALRDLHRAVELDHGFAEAVKELLLLERRGR